MTGRTAAKGANVRVQQSPDDAALAAGALSPKAAEARRRIIAVAEGLFTQRGFEGTSMRDIAAAANLNVAASYYYFPSKEELLWAVSEKGGLELLALAKSAIEGIADPW